ncbi:MAG: hypothetical protein ABL963_02680 [Longimicrobiales bacterium]
MRRPLALLALVVMTWSNASTLQCAPASVPAGRADAAAEQTGHTGHTHAPETQERGEDSEHVHPGPTSHPGTPDCGVLMACGSALGATLTHADHTQPEASEKLEVAPGDSPSTADLALDPPPPRRHA